MGRKDLRLRSIAMDTLGKEGNNSKSRRQRHSGGDVAMAVADDEMAADLKRSCKSSHFRMLKGMSKGFSSLLAQSIPIIPSADGTRQSFS